MTGVRSPRPSLERLAAQLEKPTPRLSRAMTALAQEAEEVLRRLHLRQTQEAMAVLEALFRAFLVGKGVALDDRSKHFYQVMGGLFTLLLQEVRGKQESHYPYLAGVLAALLALRGSRGRRRSSPPR
jgi:hypothetical protein